MKLHGIFFLTVVFVLSLFMTGIVHSKDEVTLTPEFLTSGKWGPILTTTCCESAITFTKDGRFTILYMEYTSDCRGGDGRMNVDAEGKYIIKGDKVILTIDNVKMNTGYKKGDILQGVLSDKGSAMYRWYLDFGKNGMKNYNYNILVKEGDTVSIEGKDAISMGSKNGTVVTTLKIRKAPDASAQEVEYETRISDKDVMTKSIEKGKSLTVIARTKEKDKVGKLNNYWYYVEFFNENWDHVEVYIRGWVFGEFVKIK